MTADSSLVLTGLVKRYGDITAVDGIDLKIDSGSYCCLLGPSGCGKTSTLRMIAGHEFATDGRVLLGGKDITRSAAADRGTAMMFQTTLPSAGRCAARAPPSAMSARASCWSWWR